jgi:PTS system nitrogen regulatory IIA component
MKITSILSEESLIPELKSKSKNEVIRELGEAIHKVEPSIPLEPLVQILMEREKLGSTGIGSGVAIPHGKIANLDHIVAAFGRSKAGIDFYSQDGEPTYLFFVLVAPENTAGLHLKALAKLSRLLKDSNFRDRLMKVPDAKAIYQIISEEDEKS